MRLSRVVPAVALALALFAPSIPLAAASHGASVAIVSPGEGVAVGVRGNVTLHAAGFHGGVAQGYLMLDGVWAGSLASTPVVPGGTTFSATLNATGFAAGAYALTARVFTMTDAPVDSAPVAVVLDLPPVVSASAAYDLDARALHVVASVEDEGLANVTLRAGSSSVSARFVGTQELVLPLARSPGNYTARLSAVDALGQNTTITVAYEVGDREAEIEIIEVTYLMGDLLRVAVRASDPEGLKSVAANTSLGGGRDLNYDDETGQWSALLRIDARIGDHTGVVTTRDVHGGTSNATFSFTLGGPREVLFERTVTTDMGLYVDAIELFLPRVHEGRIEICLDGVCSGDAYWLGTQVEAVIFEGIALPGPQQPRVCTSPRLYATTCAFDIRNPGGWNLDIAWQQVGRLDVTVRVSGVRI